VHGLSPTGAFSSGCWGALVAYFAWCRCRAEKKAGAVRFVLAIHSYFMPRAPAILQTMLGVLVVVIGPMLWAVPTLKEMPDTSIIWEDVLSAAMYCLVVVSGFGVANLWWQRSVRLCEAGFVLGFEFIEWSPARRWYFDAVYKEGRRRFRARPIPSRGSESAGGKAG